MNIFIAILQNNKALLTPEESWHCSKVLRKKAGDKINVIDGNGNFHEGVLELVSEKQCVVVNLSEARKQILPNYYLHLAIAPTKQIDRIEWMVEKAVEIGINEISFFTSQNSERTNLKLERIQKIVESAVKQSIQAYIPKLNNLMSFKELISNSNNTQKLIAHCHEGEKINIKNISFINQSSIVMIGPEGDFAPEEITLAEKNKFVSISLGTNRLRTETAGLYVCQAASLLTAI